MSPRSSMACSSMAPVNPFDTFDSRPNPDAGEQLTSALPRPLLGSTQGEFTLTRDLGRGAVGERFLALNPDRQTSHIAYRVGPCSGPAERVRLQAVFDAISGLRHPHIQPLQELVFEPARAEANTTDAHAADTNSSDPSTAWIITPFCGDADGLRSLARLVRAKGGQLSQIEAEQAVTQVLEALACAHSRPRPDAVAGQGVQTRTPIFHGPLSFDEILVDSHGRVIIETLGVARRLRGMLGGNSETVRDEIVRVCEIAYQLLTGLRAEEPLIPATRLVPRLSKAWDQWLRMGLDPSRGFESAEHALAHLPAAVEGLSVVVPGRRVPARA